MDLTTTYLGMEMRTPLICAASPLSQQLDNVKRMEDAGASAVVLHSLFEEQLRQDRLELQQSLERGVLSSPEALSYFPDPGEFKLGPDEYLAHLKRAKETVDIPVIASLNARSAGGWTGYAREIQAAGADALELNIYHIPTDAKQTSADIEAMEVQIVREVNSKLTIPVAVKLSPFFTNFSNVAARFDDAGAGGLVLFNRFYQPDIDLDTLEVRPNILASTPMAMRLPLRWIAILYGRVSASLAATSGVYSGGDVLKLLLAGADAVMLCSVLMRRGIGQIRTIEWELVAWMEKHEFASVRQVKGSLSQKNCADPAAFERAQYLRAITSQPTASFGSP
ncbi:MAG: dihydroorotate dehydrogenase-like protein [Verrucomicrobiota bacterium]|jgi:dihydroorotate dehydrogenase (fumarate)